MKILPLLLLFLLSLITCSDYHLLGNDEPPEKVEVRIETISDTSVTLTWTECSDDDFRFYYVYYDSSQSGVVDTSSQVVDTLKFKTDTRIIVSGLERSTNYFFRVVVEDEWGNISISDPVDTTTLFTSREILDIHIVDSLVTDTSIDIYWNETATANSIFKQYLIYIDSTGRKDTANSRLETLSRKQDTVLHINELKKNTDYWVAVYAENRKDELVSESQFLKIETTDALPRAIEPITIEDSITDSSLYFTWEANDDEEFKQYLFYWDTVAEFDTSEIENLKIKEQDTDALKLEGLAQSTMYYLLALVEDPDGRKSLSAICSTKTENRVPDSVTVSVSMVGDDEARVRWSQVNTKNTDLRQYVVSAYAFSDTSIFETLTVPAASDNDSTITFTGLIPARQYWFQVVVEDTGGLMRASDYVLNYPTVLMADSATVTDSSVVLKWEEYPLRDFKKYKMYMDTDSGTGTRGTPIADISNQDSVSVTISDLSQLTQYYFTILVSDTSRATKPGNVLAVRTKNKVPEPFNLQVVTVTNTTTQLRWNSSKDANLQAYHVYSSISEEIYTGDSADSITTDTSITMTGLATGKRYWFKVIAVDSSGAQTETNAVTNFSILFRSAELTIDTAAEPDTTYISLKWERSTEPDFEYYTIYRHNEDPVTLEFGTEITPNAIEQKATTTYTDTIPGTYTGPWFYRIYYTVTGTRKLYGSNTIEAE